MVRAIAVLSLCAAAVGDIRLRAVIGRHEATVGQLPLLDSAASGSLTGPSDDALTLRLASARNYLTRRIPSVDGLLPGRAACLE